MLLYLYAVLMMGSHGDFLIRDTEIYDILDANTLAVSDSFDFFLLNRKGFQVKCYDKTGALKFTIGSRGQGPGEFAFIYSVRYRNGIVYAFDPMQSTVQLFDANGEWLRKLPVPRSAIMSFPYLIAVDDGWIYADPAKATLNRLDLEFQNQEVIARIPDFEESRFKIVPAGEALSFSYDPKESLIFYWTGGPFQIQTYSTQQHKSSHTITKRIPRVPMSKAFAEERAAYILSYRDPKGENRHRYKMEFPEFFPTIESIQIDPDGFLVVWPGIRLQNRDAKPLVMDGHGQSQTSKWPVKHLSRIIAVDGNHAYVTAYQGDEFGIAHLPIHKLSTFFETNRFNND